MNNFNLPEFMYPGEDNINWDTRVANLLERCYDSSDDLVTVNEDTIPDDVNIPLLLEWGDIG